MNTTSGTSFAKEDTKTRVEKGQEIERRILKVIQYRWKNDGRNVKLRYAHSEEDFQGTDGIFTENGTERLYQSKSRDRKEGYSDIGFEICRRYNHLVSNIDVYPGRELLRNHYDAFVCLTWPTLLTPTVVEVDGNGANDYLMKVVDDFKRTAREKQQAHDRNLWNGRNKRTMVLENHPQVEIKHVHDPNDFHSKLIAYVNPAAFDSQYVKQYALTKKELAFIYEGVGNV